MREKTVVSTPCGTCYKNITAECSNPLLMSKALEDIGAVFQGIWFCSEICKAKYDGPFAHVASHAKKVR
jgi:hypothetical protein